LPGAGFLRISRGDIASTWDALTSGRTGIGRITHFDLQIGGSNACPSALLNHQDDAHSPNTALVTLDIEGEEHLIDFLGGLKGFTFQELEKVKHSAMPVGLVPGRHQPILVMHPAHCLESQLENVYGYQLNRRAEPGGERYIGRIKLAIESCRRITQRYVDEGDLRGALKVVEKVHTLSLLPAALRARVEDDVRIEDGILDAASMPSQFLEERLPRIRRIHELKLAKYRRIHGSK